MSDAQESDVYHGRKKFFSLRSQEEYLRLFKNVKKEKVLGEVTSKYLYSKVAVKNIYKFNPDSKIIIMLRDMSCKNELFIRYLRGT